MVVPGLNNTHVGASKELKSIVVEAPASIANIGPGFDVLAMAIEGLSDRVKIVVEQGAGNIIVESKGIKVPDGKCNVAHRVVKKAIEEYGLHDKDFYITVFKGVPVSLGLGSSGATAAATIYALSKVLDLDLGIRELIRFAGEGEALAAGSPHYDNVAASLLGGIVIVDPVSMNAYKINVKKDFWIAIVSPEISFGFKKTMLARSLLPREITIDTCVKQYASIAKMIYALYQEDLELFGESISADYIAEPYRSKLIPGYWELKKIARENGALGFNIAGAGPSVFSIYRSEVDAYRAGTKIMEYLLNIGVKSRLYVTKISNQGARIVG